MTYTVEKVELLKGLSVIKQIISKNVVSVFSKAYMKFTDVDIYIYGNNGISVSADTRVPVKPSLVPTGQEETVLVPIGVLEELVSKMSGTDVDLIVTAQNITVVPSGKSKPFYVVNGIELGNFRADIPVLVDTKKLVWNSTTLYETITRAVAAGKETKYGASVLFKAGEKPNEVEVVSTDGKTMTIDTVLGDSVPAEFNISVPVPAIKSMLKMASSIKPDKLTWEFDNNNIIFSVGISRLFGALSKAVFPEYKKITDSFNFKNSFTINAEELYGALDRIVSLLDKDEFSIEFSISGAILTLNKRTVKGSGNEEVTVTTIATEDSSFKASGENLLEVLKLLAGKDITLKYEESNRPLTISEGAYTYIFMPMI